MHKTDIQHQLSELDSFCYPELYVHWAKWESFGRMVFIPPVEFRDLENQCQGALKLFWRHVVAQHLTKTLHVGFSFNLSPACTFLGALSGMCLASPTSLCVYSTRHPHAHAGTARDTNKTSAHSSKHCSIAPSVKNSISCLRKFWKKSRHSLSTREHWLST